MTFGCQEQSHSKEGIFHSYGNGSAPQKSSDPVTPVLLHLIALISPLVLFSVLSLSYGKRGSRRRAPSGDAAELQQRRWGDTPSAPPTVSCPPRPLPKHVLNDLGDESNNGAAPPPSLAQLPDSVSTSLIVCPSASTSVKCLCVPLTYCSDRQSNLTNLDPSSFIPMA
jgi:hypothetical protein